MNHTLGMKMVDLFIVEVSGLNIRSSPKVVEDNIITSLPKGHVLSKIEVATEDNAWWKILTIDDSHILEGFAAHRFLGIAPRRIKAIGWFKEQFRNKIGSAIGGTPFSLDLLAGIAMQETYYIWGKLYDKLALAEVLQLCTGDTLDTPNRSAFPKDKADLLSKARGDEMFVIARTALEDVGKHVPAFKQVAESSPNKFCRGYGIFQLDLQFFLNKPDYFLQQKWHDFDECLSQCVNELNAALKRAYGPGKNTLTDEEKVYVAIAYNRGSVDFSRKFRQGFRDDSGKYYGEYIWEYLQLAKFIP